MGRMAIRGVARHRLIRLLWIGLLSFILVGWQHHTAPGAAAAWWSTVSNITCGTGKVPGVSQLEWDGYFFASSGETYNTIWYWSGSSWDIASQAYGSDSGSSGMATAVAETYFQGTSFYVTASHGSTFFSGWQSSSTNTIYC